MSSIANALRRAMGVQEENDPNFRTPTYHQRKVLARNATDAMQAKQNTKKPVQVSQGKRS